WARAGAVPGRVGGHGRSGECALDRRRAAAGAPAGDERRPRRPGQRTQGCGAATGSNGERRNLSASTLPREGYTAASGDHRPAPGGI
ncbi:MAG: hypothetical protein AVDCRST_MAG88-2023, partial [uncultured Thermomicrobiales bacterium]